MINLRCFTRRIVKIVDNIYIWNILYWISEKKQTLTTDSIQLVFSTFISFWLNYSHIQLQLKDLALCKFTLSLSLSLSLNWWCVALFFIYFFATMIDLVSISFVKLTLGCIFVNVCCDGKWKDKIWNFDSLINEYSLKHCSSGLLCLSFKCSGKKEKKLTGCTQKLGAVHKWCNQHHARA